MTPLLLRLATFTLCIAPCLAGTGPVIDLGYNLQQATAITTIQNAYDVYSFYDVRYAASTTGANRFKAPRAPLINRSTVQTGGQHRSCPQAGEAWSSITGSFFQQYDYGRGKTTFNPSDFPPIGPPDITPDAQTSEDCLFLDVYVPKMVLDSVGKGESTAPVLVQIYGGGYVSGSKDLNPSGFFVRDQEQGGNGLVIVSLNYRLGAFGFLAGSKFLKDGGDANAGLLDQRFALQWVQTHISKFGGNPNNVTVIGESAGGGSIMHQITAYGGVNRAVPFQKAIIQSPGIPPKENDDGRNMEYANFLELAGVSNMAQARQLSFAAVYAANVKQIYAAPYGQFVYGPSVDGTFVPDLAAKLLLDGKFDKSVAVVVGHNVNEAIGFTNPFVQNDTDFEQVIGSWIPIRVATPANVNFIASSMYPSIFDGSQGYTDQIGRLNKALTELIFTCYTFYLDKAYNNLTRSYYFAVPPAIHGTDIPYTYYTDISSSDSGVQVAVNMQRYFLNFIRTGDPNGKDVVAWPTYGTAAQVKVFNTTGNLRMQRDDVANERCSIWQTNL